MAATNGIPTARSIDHVGITVPDIDEAEEFFVNVLGAKVVYRATPPIDESVQDWMERNLGVHPDSTMRLVKMRCGPATNVELLEYDDPTQRDEHPKNSDPGATHLCFYVEDMEAAVDYLREVPGAELQGEPRVAEEGPEEGQSFVYFKAPWGLQLELIHTPPHTAFKGTTPAELYGPAPNWDANPGWAAD